MEDTFAFYGYEGYNNNGSGPYGLFMISGGTQGKILFKLPANSINNGKPAEIIQVTTSTIGKLPSDGYNESDTCTWWFTSDNKLSWEQKCRSRVKKTWGSKTVNYFNSLRDANKCFSTTQIITLRVSDDSSSSGSLRVRADEQQIILTWRSLTPVRIFNGTEWIEAEPEIYIGETWAPAECLIYNGNDWVTC